MSSVKILVVDDEPVIAYSLQRYLSGKGYDVTVTTEGDKALSLMDTENFDVVLTDLKMHPISGLEIINNLRSRAFRGRVIAMTAFYKEHAADLENLKIDALLEKPFDLKYLPGRIKELTE